MSVTEVHPFPLLPVLAALCTLGGLPPHCAVHDQEGWRTEKEAMNKTSGKAVR